MATKQSNKPAATTEAAKPAAPAKPNARQHLRNMFAKVGDTHDAKDVFGDYYKVTIQTHLTDLKNPKYAGKQGTMSIVKTADGKYKRVA